MAASVVILPSAFSYAEMVRVLAVMFEATDESGLAKLKARIRKLQAENLPLGKRPSRGENSFYSLGQLIQIVMYLELAELGLAPSLVAAIAEEMELPSEIEDGNSRNHRIQDIIEAIKAHITGDASSPYMNFAYLRLYLCDMSKSWKSINRHISWTISLSIGGKGDVYWNEEEDRRSVVIGLRTIAKLLARSIESCSGHGNNQKA